MSVMISAWARHASIGDPKFADIASSAKFSVQANRPGNRLLGMSSQGTWTRIYVLRKLEIDGAQYTIIDASWAKYAMDLSISSRVDNDIIKIDTLPSSKIMACRIQLPFPAENLIEGLEALLKGRTVVDINDSLNGAEFTLNPMPYNEIPLNEWEKDISLKEHV